MSDIKEPNEELESMNPIEDSVEEEITDAPAPKQFASAENVEPHWYILHTYSGYENLVMDNLDMVFKKNHIEERLFDVRIPMEDVVEEKNGKRKVVRRKMFPGYVLIKMTYTRDMWHIITGTRGVTGFVGPQGKPTPLTEDEVRRMNLEKVTIVTGDFEVGDRIKVMQGPLSDMIGEVKSVNVAAGKVNVEINMFGRLTPAELEIGQIEKVDLDR